MNLHLLRFVFKKERPWLVFEDRVLKGDAVCEVKFPSGFSVASNGYGDSGTMSIIVAGGGGGGKLPLDAVVYAGASSGGGGEAEDA